MNTRDSFVPLEKRHTLSKKRIGYPNIKFKKYKNWLGQLLIPKKSEI